MKRDLWLTAFAQQGSEAEMEMQQDGREPFSSFFYSTGSADAPDVYVYIIYRKQERAT